MKGDLCIGVCTFRRESLFRTLDSLQRLDLPDGIRPRIIVSDNDETARLSAPVADYAGRTALPIRYIHAPSRNISIARNACLDAAEGDFLAFLDDDEIAEPDWITRLLSTAARTGAGAVFGPIVACYPETAPKWIRQNDFHSNRPTLRGDVVETGYSGNVLLDLRDPRVRQTRFDLAFGRTGGEDVEFFFELHRQGVRMVIDDEAVVREPVPLNRLSFRWLLQRKYQTGAIYSHCAVNGSLPMRAKLFAGSLAKSGYCGLRAVAALTDRTRSAFWVMRGGFHVGVLQGCLYRPRLEVYGR